MMEMELIGHLGINQTQFYFILTAIDYLVYE